MSLFIKINKTILLILSILFLSNTVSFAKLVQIDNRWLNANNITTLSTISYNSLFIDILNNADDADNLTNTDDSQCYININDKNVFVQISCSNVLKELPSIDFLKVSKEVWLSKKYIQLKEYEDKSNKSYIKLIENKDISNICIINNKYLISWSCKDIAYKLNNIVDISKFNVAGKLKKIEDEETKHKERIRHKVTGQVLKYFIMSCIIIYMFIILIISIREVKLLSITNKSKLIKVIPIFIYNIFHCLFTELFPFFFCFRSFLLL